MRWARPSEAWVVAVVLLLCCDAPLAEVNAAVSSPANAASYGQPEFAGFTDNPGVPPMGKIYDQSVVGLLAIAFPILSLLFYSKVMDSYAADTYIRRICPLSERHVQSFTTEYVLFSASEDTPTELTSRISFALRPHNDTLWNTLVPDSMLSEEEMENNATEYGHVISTVQGNDKLQPGDVITQINCVPVDLPEELAGEHILSMMAELGKADLIGIRLPFVVTILRPVKHYTFCPPFLYNPLKTSYCCAKPVDDCDEADQSTGISAGRFKEIAGSKLLSDVMKQQRESAPEDFRPDEEYLLEKKVVDDEPVFKRRNALFKSKLFIVAKHVFIVLFVGLVTLGFLYLPFFLPRNPTIRDHSIMWLVYGAAASLLFTLITYALIVRHNRDESSEALHVINLHAVSLAFWVCMLAAPAAAFVYFSGDSENRSQRSQAQFSLTTTYVGTILAMLYWFHAVLAYLHEIYDFPVPEVLPGSIADLVLGSAGFLDAIGAFREMARGAHANGGACNLGELNSYLFKITRDGAPVRWACETDVTDTLDVSVADGTACNVMCSPTYVKPVTCYDYGLRGGQWTIMDLDESKFCCHPFACPPNLKFCPNLCGASDSGCRDMQASCES